MSRVSPLEFEQTSGTIRKAFEEGLARFGRLTNMKRTLLHCPPAYHALMEWYTLFEVVKGFLGERLAIIFSLHIRRQNADRDVRNNASSDGCGDPQVAASQKQRWYHVALCPWLLSAVGFIGCLLVGGNHQSHQYWKQTHLTGVSADLRSLRHRR